MSAGDYRLFCSETAQIRSLETDRQFAKARHWQAFLRVLGTFSLIAGLVGWRRSADRTRLQANSLVYIREFHREFCDLVSQKPISLHKTAVLQRFLVKFPTRIIRENNLKNKEF
jgi:hypothetical protein